MVKRNSFLTSLGVLSSVVCAVHCLLLPVFIFLLPLWGYSLLNFISLEWGLLLLTIVLAILSALHGYFFRHCNLVPSKYFLLGIIFLLISTAFHLLYIEYIFSFIGGVILIVAHTKNHSCCKRQ